MLWIAALPLPVLYACLIYIGSMFALLLIVVAYFPKAANRIFRLLDELYRLRYGSHTHHKRYHPRSHGSKKI